MAEGIAIIPEPKGVTMSIAPGHGELFDWTNLMIGLPPAPHLLDMLGAMSARREIADEFTNSFNYPERQWDILATPERTRRFLSRYDLGKQPA